ncbi:hypothetical protein CC86DRAFT_450688 [Ophiobolus disseminans]|uniref:HMG box domain-containing protein n=1 Tax=Ophiobolus disseminans TaxID=1469910 RepID=A0A6A7AIP0_9PLEO|nr:hypothetical protein CC86DRAFT_450688 [Ophiobolus disseminans]
MPNEQPLFSPPTPRSTTEEDYGRRTTRSGRAVAPSNSPRRKEASPRPKATPKAKKTKAKGDKPATPKLTAPLSIMTAELHHIPVKNMEEWVNRPADVRRDEAEKRNGYITRPMNSFMLYRSAYAERAKSWCAQNNHQIVSSVAGESWPLEPPGIRELYNEYAKIERINHQNAHPTYKFSPSKAAAPARKRKGEWSDEDEPSDLEDVEWAPGSGRSRNRQTRRLERSLSYTSNGMNGDFFDRSFGPNGHGMNKSSWEMTNDGRPMPMPMPMHNDMYNQYYQSAAYPGMMGPNFHDDPRMRRVGTPNSSVQFSSDHALLGLPGGNSGDLMQQLHSQVGTLFDDGQLDPMLLAYDGGHHQGEVESTALHPGFRNGHVNGMLDTKADHHDIDSLLELLPAQDEYRNASWQSDPTMASLEQESEFDKWMG